MRAVDTNVIVRLFARDNARQVAEAESFVENGAWVPLLAVAEAIWVLGSTYNLSAKEQAEIIDMLLDHRDLVVQDSEVVVSALRLFKVKPSLGFTDCLMIEIARKAGHLPLGTFDRGLARVDGAHKL
jgi:predicted nucleic-acid-binding protein